MEKGAVRHVLLALFAVSVLGAGYVLWDTYTFVSAGLALERDVHSRLDRLSEAAAGLGAAQQAYVAPGQQRGEALTRASVLIQELYDELSTVRRIARSADAQPSLLAVGEAVDALVKVDDRVRDHLRADQELMAADLVYTEARQTLDAMTKRLSALKEAEDGAGSGGRRAVLTRGGAIVGSILLVWMAIALGLARMPVPVRAPLQSPAAPHREPAPQPEPAAPSLASDAPPAREPAPASVIDLDEAAAVCAELAQVTNGAALSRVLARAARVLDASGMIVWLGAGEELFAATAYGYGAHAISRLGAIARSADNVTAGVWRSAKGDIVTGDGAANGVIVAPLAGANGCFGVLSVEVRDGRERNAAVRAITTMFAAQLSTIVAPGPAASQQEAASA